MNMLRLLPPETAHRLALFAVKHGLVPHAPETPELRIQLLGKTFLNPIGLAAGADKKCEALSGWLKMGFGFVEFGSVTRRPRPGNPQPRLWRLPHNSLINWLGLPGDGMEAFVKNLNLFTDRKGLVVGVSLASPDGKADELRELSASIAPLADYLTLNMSCPNVAGHAPPDMTLVKAVVSEAGGKPVLVKLAPTYDDAALAATVKAAMDAGAAGFVATNTVSFDNRVLLASPPVWPAAKGGYSGPGLLDISCWMVENIRSIVGVAVPIMGCGGVQSGADALRLFKSGADAVQLYTGLVYKGPSLLADIRQACLSRLRPGQPLR